MHDKHQYASTIPALHQTDAPFNAALSLVRRSKLSIFKTRFKFYESQKAQEARPQGTTTISYALGQKLYEGENCQHIYLYCEIGWGREGLLEFFSLATFLLLSVAHRPSVSTLVAQQDPRRPILEEFNFGNRPVTYASLKTKNMFVYRG